MKKIMSTAFGAALSVGVAACGSDDGAQAQLDNVRNALNNPTGQASSKDGVGKALQGSDDSSFARSKARGQALTISGSASRLTPRQARLLMAVNPHNNRISSRVVPGTQGRYGMTMHALDGEDCLADQLNGADLSETSFDYTIDFSSCNVEGLSGSFSAKGSLEEGETSGAFNFAFEFNKLCVSGDGASACINGSIGQEGKAEGSQTGASFEALSGWKLASKISVPDQEETKLALKLSHIGGPFAALRKEIDNSGEAIDLRQQVRLDRCVRKNIPIECGTGTGIR